MSIETSWTPKTLRKIPFAEAVVMLELCSEDIMREVFSADPNMERFSLLVRFRSALRDRILERR